MYKKIRDKSNGYSHINGILIIKFLENTKNKELLNFIFNEFFNIKV